MDALAIAQKSLADADRRIAAPTTSRRIARARISTPSIAACATCCRFICRPDDFARLEPHFDRLGALAGGRLDELARIADKHPPVLHPRDRFGRDEDWIDYHAVLSRDGEDRLRRFPVPRHEPSRRRARHGPAAAGGRQIRAAISVRAGRVRPDVPDQRHRHLDPSDPQIRRARSCRIICCRKCCPATSPRMWKGTQFMTERAGGSDVGAIETIGALRGRRVAALRRQMVLLACRRRCRAAAGAAGGRARRHQGPRAVRAAAPAEGRPPQQPIASCG